jgi:hypothetical protein
MNLYSKDKVYKTKMLCKENYEVIIIMIFLLHQSIVSKCF